MKIAPSGPGGRPSNAWTGQRRRQLVRLYTLTTLSNEEIREALKSSDFYPGLRDIQKTLRSLFPPDYTKRYREYRPSNDTDMYRRIDHIRRCKKGRISKQRHQGKNSKSMQCKIAYARRSRSSRQWIWPDSFEGPADAFRKYNASSDQVPVVVENSLTDSQPIISELVMLDGSTLKPRHTSQQTPHSKSGNDLEDSAICVQETKRGSGSFRSLQRFFAGRRSPNYLKQVDSVMRYSSSNSWRSSVTSLLSIASSDKRVRTSLERRESADIQSQVASYHISEAGQDLSSAREMFHESHESDRSRTPVALVTSQLHHRSKEEVHNTRPVSTQSKHCLTVPEVEIWNELINEGELEVSRGGRPKYLTASLRNRTCCMTQEDPISGSSTCQRCGLTLDHRRALQVSTFPGVVPGYDKSLDFYGNTMLHCLAVTAHHPNKLWKMRMMILEGADVQQRNTSGENFLHLLCENGPRNDEEMKDFIHLLEELSELRFPFQHRDHHGHTFLHILFRHITAHQLSVDYIGQLLLIPKISLYTMDNSGSSVLDFLITNPAIIYDTSEIEKLLDYMETLQDRWNSMDENLVLSYESGRVVWTTNSRSRWVDAQCKSRILDYSDTFGDTVLARILKHEEDPILLWERAELVIRAGADIEMRDRNGDTALMIAAKRGLRAIVIILLKEGANVHSRSYNGSGILAQAEMESALAQLANNNERYAKILSCLPPLLRANVKHDPSEEDEFIIPAKNRSNKSGLDQLSIRI